jgi:hypothetical protein
MRKLRLLLFTTFLTVGANAQYFQHVYGEATPDILESGVNANAISPHGHIMTGYSEIDDTNHLSLVRTDLDGRFASPPTFNNTYRLYEHLQLIDAKGRSVVHLTACDTNISVWGDFGTVAGGVSTKFFYARFTPAGMPVILFSYALPLPFEVVEAEATSMCISTTDPGNVFMCGFVRLVVGGQRYPVVMSVNACTGEINWARVYTIGNNIDWIATDLVESPYLPASGIPNVALSGRMTVPLHYESACFFNVSTATGAVSGPLRQYGSQGYQPSGFNAIAIASGSMPYYGPGFVFGGYEKDPTSGLDNSWIIKTDPAGTFVNFSRAFDNSIPGNSSCAYDVIERQSTLSSPFNYEYYLGGYVSNGVFGGDDEVVYKVDYSGIPISQITFGGPGDERAYQLDQYNGIGPDNDGLSTFGITTGSWAMIGATDFYLGKSYFNGVQTMNCNYHITYPLSALGGRYAGDYAPTIVTQLDTGNLSIDIDTLTNWEVCWDVMDGGGNNSRLSVADQLTQPGYFPNPVSHDNAIVTVTFGKEVAEGIATVELWNSLGQLCWTKNVPAAKGQTKMQLELGKELMNGMYYLIVRQSGALHNYRILVQ